VYWLYGKLLNDDNYSDKIFYIKKIKIINFIDTGYFFQKKDFAFLYSDQNRVILKEMLS